MDEYQEVLVLVIAAVLLFRGPKLLHALVLRLAAIGGRGPAARLVALRADAEDTVERIRELRAEINRLETRTGMPVCFWCAEPVTDGLWSKCGSCGRSPAVPQGGPAP